MLHVEPPQFEEERESSDDFFFGYLQLKWRRLFRVLCLGAIGILPIIFLELSDNWFDELEGFLSYFMSLGLVIFLIGLISWVLKPFIVNRDEEKENRFRKSLKPGLNEDEIDEMRDFMRRADHHLEKIKEKRFKNLGKKK